MQTDNNRPVWSFMHEDERAAIPDRPGEQMTVNG